MSTAKGERPAEPMTAAVDGWLKARLAKGEQPASDIYAAGKETGYSEDQLRRARRRMNGRVRRAGFPSRCYWSLPMGCANTPVSKAAPTALASAIPTPPAVDARKRLKLSEMQTDEKRPPYWHPWHSRHS